MQTKIDKWAVVTHWDLYMAPELCQRCLTGIVTGHRKFNDGETVTTSAISHREGDIIVTASGSRYELGDVAMEYEARFPDAKTRLLGSLTDSLSTSGPTP